MATWAACHWRWRRKTGRRRRWRKAGFIGGVVPLSFDALVREVVCPILAFTTSVPVLAVPVGAMPLSVSFAPSLTVPVAVPVIVTVTVSGRLRVGPLSVTPVPTATPPAPVLVLVSLPAPPLPLSFPIAIPVSGPGPMRTAGAVSFRGMGARPAQQLVPQHLDYESKDMCYLRFGPSVRRCCIVNIHFAIHRGRHEEKH